jgi:LPS sulfotransferase NodH
MTPFAIVADLRTGSTLLSSSLDRHPDVRCFGELLHPADLADNVPEGADRHGSSGRALVGRVFASPGVAAAGFRAMVFLPLPEQPRWADAWDELAATPGLRVIYLVRRDVVAQYASLLVAARLGAYHPAPGDPALTPANRPTLRLERDELLAWAQERARLLELRRAQLAGKTALELTYEQLAGDWPDAIARAQAFLGVTPLPLAPAKEKQERRALREVVANYDELRADLGEAA